MKNSRHLLLLLSSLTGMMSLLCSCSTSGEELPKFNSIFDPKDAHAFEQEKLADFRADYDHEGKLDIMIGVLRDGVRHPRTFTLDELELFWKEHGAGKFVCVTLAKANLEKDEQKKLVARLAEYFFKCGLKRVRIHQAYGSGVGVLYDNTR